MDAKKSGRVMLNYTPFLIVGMHRSGTSCLTGSLEKAGMFLGDVNTYAKFNEKGNRENRAIMDLHDIVLARSGNAWDNPPTLTPVWTEGDRDQLLSLLEAYEGIGIWGVKDPRTLLVVQGWQTFTQPRFIGTFRHPAEVAASLVYRSNKQNNPMEMDAAYGLWEDYNKRLLKLYYESPFDIIRYDVEPDIYKANLSIIAENLGLDPDTIKHFREDSLHNQKINDKIVPDQLRDTWEALNDVGM